MMQECDTLLVVGCSFPYAEFYPKVGQAKGVQIDSDGRMLSLRYPMDVCLKGDAKDTLQALLPLIKRKQDREWQEQISEWSAASWENGRGAGEEQLGHAGHDQSGAGLLRAVAEAAEQLHSVGRQRHERQLVRPRPENPPRA